ncbi:MAG: G1 family glutamic endopeptidase [Solirubrobacteraceae bacterium]
MIPAIPNERVPAAGGTLPSTNWSGYAVRSSKHAISRATARFTVPTAGSPPAGFASTWVGVGGFSTQDLIQAGIGEQPTTPHYFAWWEKLPNSAVPINSKSVAPGDRVAVTVAQISSRKWKISLTDTGHWSLSKTVNYNSTRSSAEWILEAPTVGGVQTKLPGRLSTVMFRNKSTYVTNGATNTIAHGNPDKIIMVTSSGKREATPSALASNGQSFNDCAWTSNCSAR